MNEERVPARDQLSSDLELLVSAIPEEVRDEQTYYAANRLYDFIQYHTAES